MAHLRCDFFSDALALSTSMTVLLPEPATEQIGMTGSDSDAPPPVLYLLHGLSDDDTTWLRRTSIERYVAQRGWAVVMPAVHRSFYADEAYGGRFWTFVSEELPDLVRRFFRVSDRRSDTFVAGLSMGGYGAFKLALRQPERFAAAASLSGVLDISSRRGRGDDTTPDPELFTRIFGPEGRPRAGENLIELVGAADPARLPALYACCGTEDIVFPDSQTFDAACRDAGVPLSTRWSRGEHEWGYWDAEIGAVLDFFAQQRTPPQT